MKKILFITALIIAVSLTSCAAGPTVSESSLQESTTQTEDQMSAAIGTWIFDMDGDKSEHIIAGKNEIYLGLTMDVTRDFYFDKDNNIIINKKTFTEDDYVFENGIFSSARHRNSYIFSIK